MTFSFMTLSTIGLFATLQNSNVCRYADCRVFYCNAEYRSATSPTHRDRSAVYHDLYVLNR
jgi:hypothetical protein